ncbi:MAG: hypothetical protein WA139_03980 [Candidatus Aenigmatarchaeota archaeon]
MDSYVYGTKEFGEQMNIMGIKNKTLRPILNDIIDNWEKELFKNSLPFEISDMVVYKSDLDDPYADEETCPRCGEQLITPASGRCYALAVDEKIVVMKVYKQKTPITTNEALWLKTGVQFTKDENGAEKIYRNIKEFAGQQNIKQIIETFVKRFDGKGTKDVIPEIRDFYLKYGYKSFFS